MRIPLVVMKSFVVAYEYDPQHDPQQENDIDIGPVILVEGWWRGIGPVPHHPEYGAWRWLAFRSQDDAERDARESNGLGRRAVVIGEANAHKAPAGFGWGQVPPGVDGSYVVWW